MKNLKTREEFLNEEISKRTLAGGLLAGGLALVGGFGLVKGIDAFDKDKSNADEYSWDMNSPASSVSLPSKFKMSKDIVSIGTDMTIEDDNGNNIGKIIERVLNIGKTFELRDAKGKILASAHQKPLNLYTEIKIFDDRGNQIGTVVKEVMESMFSPYSIYSIKDATGKIIAKSEKLSLLLPKSVDIYDNSGKSVAHFQKRFISISATYDIEIYGDIDKRLVIFIPAFLSSKEED